MIGPAIEEMLAALDPPAEDLPLVAIARRSAATIDIMSDAVATGMLPNHLGPLTKVLAELDARARKRRALKPGAPNPVRQMRREWAAKAGKAI
jgi:hypothetical protein